MPDARRGRERRQHHRPPGRRQRASGRWPTRSAPRNRRRRGISGPSTARSSRSPSRLGQIGRGRLARARLVGGRRGEQPAGQGRLAGRSCAASTADRRPCRAEDVEVLGVGMLGRQVRQARDAAALPAVLRGARCPPSTIGWRAGRARARGQQPRVGHGENDEGRGRQRQPRRRDPARRRAPATPTRRRPRPATPSRRFAEAVVAGVERGDPRRR